MISPLLPLALLALAPPAPAPAGQSARWAADWGDTACSLIRTGEENGGTTLRIEARPASERPTLLLGNPKWSTDLVADRVPAKILLLPREQAYGGYADTLASDHRSGSGLVFRIGPSPARDFLDRLSEASAVAIEARGKRLAELRLSGAAAAVKALRSCLDDLSRSWGIDPAATALLRKMPEPVGRPESWVTNSDFPMEAIKRGSSGKTYVRLTIGLDGRVRECATIHGSGDSSLDEQSCALLKGRGRYSPAIGADGLPVEARIVTWLDWQSH